MFSSKVMGNQDKKWIFTFLFPAMIFVVILQILPLLYSLYLSFQDWVLISSSSPQGFIGLTNYQIALTDPVFLQSLQFTLILTLATVPLQLILGTFLAFLVLGERKIFQIARGIFVIPMVVAPVAIGTLWRLLFNDSAGPINNHFLAFFNIPGPLWLGDQFWARVAVAIIEVWQWTPFVFVVVSAALTTIPQEITLAAQVDGASRFQIFRSIEFPLLIPAFLLVFLFRTLDSLLTLDSILSLTRGGPGSATLNMTYSIYNKGLREFDLGMASAQSWLFMIFVTLLIVIIFKLLSSSEKKFS